MPPRRQEKANPMYEETMKDQTSFKGQTSLFETLLADKSLFHRKY